MPIQVTCTKAECGKVLRVKDELAGKTIRCPACQNPTKVPGSMPVAAGATSAAPKPPGPPPMPKPAVMPQAAGPKPPAMPAPKPPAMPKAAAGKGPPPVPQHMLLHPDGQPLVPAADSAEPSAAWDQSEMLKHDRLLCKVKLSFYGANFTISNPDTKEQLGFAFEKINFFEAVLRRISVGPIKFGAWMARVIEVKETKEGPSLFSIRKPVQFFSLTQTIQIWDDMGDMIGYFKTKLFSFFGGFWVYDKDGNELAEVKAQLSFKEPHMLFAAKDGRQLGKVTSEGMDAASKGKFKLTFMPGLIVTVAPEVMDHPSMKVLLLGTTLAMELTGAGKKLVGT